jgi:hypothetical protein
MTVAREAGAQGDSNLRETALKEWRQPCLRKLPIAATASGNTVGDEGNSKKTSGSTGGFS